MTKKKPENVKIRIEILKEKIADARERRRIVNIGFIFVFYFSFS